VDKTAKKSDSTATERDGSRFNAAHLIAAVAGPDQGAPRANLDLLAEANRLNVYRGELEVRPPGAPTTWLNSRIRKARLTDSGMISHVDVGGAEFLARNSLGHRRAESAVSCDHD
jgi:hypothetical protein